MTTQQYARIEGEMIAPDNGGGKKTLPNLQIPAIGMHQALCIGIIDLGTHMESFKGEEPKPRRKIQIIFEYPELKQLVYEDDVTPRSYRIYRDISYSLYNSELLKIASALSNGQYDEKALEKVNLLNFVGARLWTGIKHAPKKGDPSIVYANIEAYSRVGNTPAPQSFISDGLTFKFFIDPAGKNFLTQNFAELPEFIRKKIMDSKEAIEYKNRGGTFAESQTPNTDSDTAPDSSHTFEQMPVPQGYSWEDVTGGGASYQDYITGGWTNQQLLERGFLKKVAVQQPAPIQQALPIQQAPPAQQAPPVQQQQQFQQAQPQQNNFVNQPIQQAPSAQQFQQAPAQQAIQQAPPVQQQAVQTPPPNGMNPFDAGDDDLPF